MPLPSVTHRSTVSTVLKGIVRLLFFAALLSLLAVAILVAPPAVLRFIDDDGLDWGRLGDIGQAYGPVSALLSALALCVAVFVQRRQLRQERVLMAREMHASVLRTAMEDPVYGQCWGPRVTPDHVDERLFYYTNTILTAWLYAWECGDLSDGAVRAYVRAMAGSEVPREYWGSHGVWRLGAARGRRHRFFAMVDEEFRVAAAAGPPSRAVESSTGWRHIRDVPTPAARRQRAHLGRGADRTMRMSSRH
jgi:hypothetical protein